MGGFLWSEYISLEPAKKLVWLPAKAIRVYRGQPAADERLCDEFMSQSYTPDQIHISAAGKKGEGSKKIAERINHGKLKKYSKFDRSSSRLQKQHAKILADIMKLKAHHGR